jgi:hypothetical protein
VFAAKNTEKSLQKKFTRKITMKKLIRIIKPTVEKMSTERLNKITSEAEHNK